MQKILICGAGGLAREARQMLKDASLPFGGFLAPEKECDGDLYLGSEENYCFSKDESVVLAIGDLAIRQKVYRALKGKNVSFFNLIHPTATVAETAILGEGNIVGYHSVIFPDVRVGNGNLFNGNNLIHHDARIGSFNNLFSRVILTGGASLGDENTLGTGAIMLPKSSLSDRCKLGPGSVLHSVIEEKNKTAIGNPAGIVK
ncbi:MAG: hypothetical protein JJU12_04910 [Chlamydiales bacterium]|nr:hypothetical protein [Chlamydiales bacterium]